MQGVFTGALNGAVAECGVESVPDLLLDMAKRMEQEARVPGASTALGRSL